MLAENKEEVKFFCVVNETMHVDNKTCKPVAKALPIKIKSQAEKAKFIYEHYKTIMQYCLFK